MRLVKLRHALLHDFLRGLGRRARRIHSRGERFRRRDHLVILRARNFFLLHQRFISPDVALGFGIIRFGLLQTRERRRLFPFGGRDAGLGVQHFGLTRRDARLRGALRDRDVRILCPQIRLCLQELCLRLLQGDFVVAGIHFRNELSCLNRLILFYVNGLDHTIDSRRDSIQMSVHLGIIGRFISPGVQPKCNGANKDHDTQNGCEKEGFAASLAVVAGCPRVVWFFHPELGGPRNR